MREIIFRGKRKDNGQWIYGSLQQLDEVCFIRGCEVNPETVGQFVRFDRNGNRIFEADLLSTDLSRPYLIVVYRNGAFMYQCHDSGKDYYDFMEPSDAEVVTQTKYHEVIGNIWEHPHLLEGRDEA